MMEVRNTIVEELSKSLQKIAIIEVSSRETWILGVKVGSLPGKLPLAN